MVIRKIGGETERNSEQAAALRAQIMPRRIGAPNDGREMIKRGILDVVDAQDGIERAAFALMCEFDASMS